MINVLPDINVNPDYGLKQGGEFRVQTVSFGDGYEQRRPDGINTVRRVWSLQWSNLDRWQKDALVDFLVEMKGAYAFLWHVPDSDDAYRVVCKKMPSWAVDDYGIYSVSAEFTEDFSL